MTVARSQENLSSDDTHRFTRLWLWLTIALTLVMVTIGGATRLTGSGLSITEWRPVTGAIPPLNAADWLNEFEKYRAIPQYELINKGMTLAEFQFIYWWEWGHRQLGRLIGLIYLLGFLWIAVRRLVSPRVTAMLFGMGLLLGLQGAVGWIMVASGLQPGMIAVAPVKLTLHLVFASLFLASLVAMVTAMTPTDEGRASAGPGRVAWLILILVFIQIALGGLVAGSRAGMIFNTWPLMDGEFIPSLSALFANPNFFENFVDNHRLVQFNHRMAAYLLLAVAVAHAFAARGAHESFAARARALLALIAAQAVLGVVTLLFAVPLWAGLAHQALAMIVLAMATVHAARGSGRRLVAHDTERRAPSPLAGEGGLRSKPGEGGF